MKDQSLIPFLLFIIFIQSSSLNAQRVNYSEYRFPEVKYKALQLNEEFVLRNNFVENESVTSFNNIFSLAQDIYENRGNFQHNASRLFSSNISLSKDLNNFRNIINSSESFRKYNNKNNFFEYGYSGNLNYSKRTKTNSFETASASVSIPVKIGHGRIDVLNEVMLSEYIIDDLRNAGIIMDTIGQEILFSFAKEIAQLNFTRILDSRNYRLQVVKTLAEWIKNNLPVKEGMEIEMTAILLDNYLSALTGFRTSGNRVAIGLAPAAYYNNNFEGKNSSDLYYGGDLLFEYTIQKPISRYLQSNFYGVMNLGLSKSEQYFIGTLISPSKYINPYAAISYRLGYFPNSRTAINMTATIDYNYYNDFNDNESIFRTKRSEITPRLFMDAAYFINYRVRLFAVGEINYHKRFIDEGLFSSQYVNDFMPNPFNNLTDWYIGRSADTFLSSRNFTGTFLVSDKISYYFRGGIAFNIY